MNAQRNLVPPLALIAVVALAWALLARGLSPFILPSPIEVGRAAWDTRQLLLPAIGVTLVETLIGLALATVLAIAIAAAMDLYSPVRRALYPILVASQTVQILAIAPLLIIWFGFGLAPKVLVVVLICFFPLALNTAAGLAAADPDYVALLTAMGAERLEIWRIVRLPAAMPAFFAGLKIAVTYSVVGATIGEWVGGSDGLGLYMLRSKNALATDQVFVGILITSALSIGLFVLVYWIERRSLPWYHSTKRVERWEEPGIY